MKRSLQFALLLLLLPVLAPAQVVDRMVAVVNKHVILESELDQAARVEFLLEGKPPAAELCREVCACFAASIYGESVARGESHKLAAAKVEAVCQQAFPDASGPSATEIGFYIAIVGPTSELAGRVAAILDCESDMHLIRTALTSCHAAFVERLAIVYERRS